MVNQLAKPFNNCMHTYVHVPPHTHAHLPTRWIHMALHYKLENTAGLLPPIMAMVSLTPTSVIMNFTQPLDALPSDEHRVSLSLATSGQQMANLTESTGVDGSWLVEFSNLSEYTVYNITITTMHFGYGISKLTSFEFTTLSSCKLS